ncbi:MAG TPA: autotransporter assembly complex family protein [Gemmatimonadales bacterium]|jgi:translocation and assembly module TamA|nr:autotransporter assembly complex family protein [Gemmatimonadales bacterium]
MRVGESGGGTIGRRVRTALLGVLLGLPGLPLLAQDSSRVRIDITGVTPEIERNVRLVLQLVQEAAKGKLTHQRIVHLHRRAETEIETALRPFGYYEPRIVKSLQPGDQEWVALYVIDPGIPVRVRNVTIELSGPGASSPAFQNVVASFPLRQGDTLHDVSYEAGKLRFLTAATDSGYLDADFDTTAVLVNRDNHTADILVRFETGPRFKFGPVRFEQDFLSEGLLRKRIPFKEGQPYGHRKLLELQTALAEDPYFARVEVLPEREEARQNLEVPIRVLLEPRKLWTYEVGAGYGTDTGPRGRSNAMWRRINPQGHYAEAGVILSRIEQSGWVKYNIPGIGHKAGVLTLLSGFSRSVPRDAISSRSYIAGARIFRHRLGWAETFSLSFQRANFEIGVDSGKVNLVIPGMGWERTRADSKMFPRRGIKTQVEVQASQSGIISTLSFLQLRGSAKVVYGFLPRFRILARTEVGRTFSKEFHELPPGLRFFTGGDVSVRGFSYLALGPRDSLNNVIGGPALLVGSAEVDYQFMPRLALAAFTDAGNAMQRFSLSQLEYSIGAGIRFISPIGLVRLDGAFGISRKNHPFRIHITMGPDL